MIVGYVRVLTAAVAAQDQNLDLQTDELTRVRSEDLPRKSVLWKRTPSINQNDWESSRRGFGNGLEVRPIGMVIKRANKSGRNF